MCKCRHFSQLTPSRQPVESPLQTHLHAHFSRRSTKELKVNIFVEGQRVKEYVLDTDSPPNARRGTVWRSCGCPRPKLADNGSARLGRLEQRRRWFGEANSECSAPELRVCYPVNIDRDRRSHGPCESDPKRLSAVERYITDAKMKAKCTRGVGCGCGGGLARQSAEPPVSIRTRLRAIIGPRGRLP